MRSGTTRRGLRLPATRASCSRPKWRSPSPSAFYGKVSKKRCGKPDTSGWGWYEARRVAVREDLRFHVLRHGAWSNPSEARDRTTYGAEVAALTTWLDARITWQDTHVQELAPAR